MTYSNSYKSANTHFLNKQTFHQKNCIGSIKQFVGWGTKSFVAPELEAGIVKNEITARRRQ